MATELLEAARAAANGYMSPERTVLIGSTHRVFSTAENPNRPFRAVRGPGHGRSDGG